jgi:hypothetical protein
MFVGSTLGHNHAQLIAVRSHRDVAGGQISTFNAESGMIRYEEKYVNGGRGTDSRYLIALSLLATRYRWSRKIKQIRVPGQLALANYPQSIKVSDPLS